MHGRFCVWLRVFERGPCGEFRISPWRRPSPETFSDDWSATQWIRKCGDYLGSFLVLPYGVVPGPRCEVESKE
jgi:hypothetical protein